jgi:hypothetical protein
MPDERLVAARRRIGSFLSLSLALRAECDARERHTRASPKMRDELDALVEEVLPKARPMIREADFKDIRAFLLDDEPFPNGIVPEISVSFLHACLAGGLSLNLIMQLTSGPPMDRAKVIERTKLLEKEFDDDGTLACEAKLIERAGRTAHERLAMMEND